jgi:hypothetical protein
MNLQAPDFLNVKSGDTYSKRNALRKVLIN